MAWKCTGTPVYKTCTPTFETLHRRCLDLTHARTCACKRGRGKSSKEISFTGANELLSFFMKLEGNGDCSSLAVTADTFPILPSNLRQTSTLYCVYIYIHICMCVCVCTKPSFVRERVVAFDGRCFTLHWPAKCFYSHFARYFVSPVC